MTLPQSRSQRISKARPGDEIAPSRYRKLPVEIEAIRWSGTNLREVIAFTGRHPSADEWTWEHFEEVVRTKGLKIFTLEGHHMASIGDYIIKGVNGEFYACRADIFWATYERADSPLSETEPSKLAKILEEARASETYRQESESLEREIQSAIAPTQQEKFEAAMRLNEQANQALLICRDALAATLAYLPTEGNQTRLDVYNARKAIDEARAGLFAPSHVAPTPFGQQPPFLDPDAEVSATPSSIVPMESALRRLMKEAAVVGALAEPQIRETCGHNNFAAFQHAINEAGAVLGVWQSERSAIAFSETDARIAWIEKRAEDLLPAPSREELAAFMDGFRARSKSGGKA